MPDMLIAHKIELRPTPEQADYLNRACGARRHCYNQLLAHFGQEGVKWSKAAAYQHYITVIRPQFPWYNEVSSRVTRNAIDDLDSAFAGFFRRVKAKAKKPGFPKFKKKDVRDSFSLRESTKFDVEGRELRLEKLKSKIALRQKLRFSGKTKQVTVSKRAGKYFASILVETDDYDPKSPQKDVVGVDFGIKSLAVLSNGEEIPANQALKRNLGKLKKLQRSLSRKKKGSNRRAKAKLKIAKLHLRISQQRQAMLHLLSDKLTKEYKVVVIEDLNVSGMLKNRHLARAVADAGFHELRRQIEYKAKWRAGSVVIANQWFPSSKTCHQCGQVHDMPLSQRQMVCDCGLNMDRDLNAAKNLELYGRDSLERDLNRTQELSQSASAASMVTV